MKSGRKKIRIKKKFSSHTLYSNFDVHNKDEVFATDCNARVPVAGNKTQTIPFSFINNVDTTILTVCMISLFSCHRHHFQGSIDFVICMRRQSHSKLFR
jgi:hypothetical protein